jgi:hypothetical protein
MGAGMRVMVACCVLLLALYASSATAEESLRAVRPVIMKKSFTYMGDVGLMYSEPVRCREWADRGTIISSDTAEMKICAPSSASPSSDVCLILLSYLQSLFGLPNYQAKVQAMVKTPSMSTPTTGVNRWGCLPYDAGFAPLMPDGSSASIVALVERGNCTFGQKALIAQQAGADAIIVYTNPPPSIQYPLPKMAGGDYAKSLDIPGMLIGYYDGQILLSNVGQWIKVTDPSDPSYNPTSPYFKGVWVELAYEIVSPDDHVESVACKDGEDTHALGV